MTIHPVRAVVSSVLTLGLLVASVHAATVHHTTFLNTGNDNFDNQPLGAISNGAGALPTLNPGPGSWLAGITDGGGGATGEVVTNASPGAAQGGQYVYGMQNGTQGSGHRVFLVLDLQNTITPTSDGVVTSQFSVYVDSQGGGTDESVLHALKLGTTGSGFDLAYLDFFENGRLTYGDSLSQAGDVANAFTPDAWHSVELKYTVVSGHGNDTWEFTIWNQATGQEAFSDSNISSAVDSDRQIGSVVFSSGNFAEWYIDGFVQPPSDTVVTSTNVVVADTSGVSYSSEAGVEHRLQSTPDLVSSNFSDTGAIAIGDGGPQTLFDPSGTSPTKNYRVVK